MKIIYSLLAISIFLGSCKNETSKTCTNNETNEIDTSKYTDVVLINNSYLDSIQVYITLQSKKSIVGLFGMDSSNIIKDQLCDYNGSKIPCHGMFWAKKGVEYHLGDTNAIYGANITFGAQNQQCSAAVQKGWTTGVNNFEFTVNCWWQEGKVTGAIESFDITLVDGLHSILKQSVTSNGDRNEKGLNPNFGAYWDFGAKDKDGDLLKFTSSQNGPTLESCVNIPAVYPYGCDLGYKSQNPPTPICFPVHCSTKWGNINTSQTNRQGQGGRVTCEFLNFVPVPCKKL